MIMLMATMMIGLGGTSRAQGVMVAATSGRHFGMIHPHQGVTVIPFDDLDAAQSR